MPPLVLVHEELRLAERALQRREEMGQRLRVVPDVRTGAVAATVRLAAALPTPEPPVGLALDRRGLQDGEVRGNGLDDLIGKRGIVEALGEGRGPAAQVGVMTVPVGGDRINVVKGARIPGGVGPAAGAASRIVSVVLADAQIGTRDVPGQPHDHRPLLPGIQAQRHVEAAAGARRPLGDGWTLEDLAGLDRLPDHGQSIEPAAAEPGAVDADLGIVHRGAEGALLPGPLLTSRLPEGESALSLEHGVIRRRFTALGGTLHKVAGMEGEDRLYRLVARVMKAILEGRDGKAAGVRIAGDEGAPSSEFHVQRHGVVVQLDLTKGETRGKAGLRKARQPVV